ncbi:MAG TPA: transmembrane repetitive protein, partial [Pseudoxanthomonas sp.]|nr:transmembrane repetitive protein [Pseudoxanthomonas sp.]
MTTAADIIAVLLPRKAAPTLEKQTRMPYGWGLWLRGLRDNRGAITDERARELTGIWMARPLPGFGREIEYGRIGAFRSLFRQGWEPAPRHERGLRWFAAFTSLLLHVLFAIVILWLAWVNIEPFPPAVEESRTRLEYIGEGTPEQTGSGP